MFDTSGDVRSAASRAAAWQRWAQESEARVLILAVEFAEEHPVTDCAAGYDVPGMETIIPLAGEGTPEVAEFAPAELGAALGITTAAARDLIGEALELSYRLPRCWERLRGFDLPAWRARLIARETMSLSPEAAAYVDAQVAHVAHKVTTHRMRKLVEAALLHFGQAPDDERLETRTVQLSEPGSGGLTHLAITCDTPDALAFDAALDRVATTLGTLGDGDSRDARRSKAVGILADPQLALDLINGRIDADTRRVGPPVTVDLSVHVDAATLELGTRVDGGVARVEELGPVVGDAVRRWLGRTDVRVRPVLDLRAERSVDAYEVPGRMREAELQRSPYCVFPWCNRPSRHCDVDHTVAYVDPGDGGPPGQTRPDNLGPLCRLHHRVKTHGDWQLSQTSNGVFAWISPGGARYRVDRTGTTRETGVA
ncbi:MAG: DUF222 domain-containing protein [Nocardioidaceae bacterium]